MSGALGFCCALSILRSLSPYIIPEYTSTLRQNAFFAFVLQSAIFLFLSQADWISPYIKSIAVNAYDPRSVDWIIMVDQSFTLNPKLEVELLRWKQKSMWPLYIGCGIIAIFSCFGSRFMNTTFCIWCAV